MIPNLREWQRHSNHAGGSDQNLMRMCSEESGQAPGRLAGTLEAGGPGATVGVAGVDENRSHAAPTVGGAAAQEMIPAEEHWRGLDFIAGEDTGCPGRHIRDDDPEVKSPCLPSGGRSGAAR